MCNAGALLNERTLNSEGREITFSCHLLCGSFLLSSLSLPLLKKSPDGGRVILVTSGGMLPFKFPGIEIAESSEGKNKFLFYI